MKFSLLQQKKSSALLLLILLCFPTVYASPLAENKVFELSASVKDPNTLLLNWKISPDNFLYKNRFAFHLSSDQKLGPIRYPKNFVIKKYTNKHYEVYREKLALPLAILNDKEGLFNLAVVHQGCADSGFCYPPRTTTFSITINHDLEMVSVMKTSTEKRSVHKKIPSTKVSSSPYQSLFENHNIVFIIISFYGFGLLLAFTPCVLPMVPVLSGIIVGQHKKINTKKAILLSISYVLGMSTTYALVGITIAALGQNLQTLFQSPITIGLFTLLFVVLSLSMFDFYSLSLPQSWQAMLSKRSNQHNNGAYLGAASMGALSTLILSPCVTAPLVGALSYIAKTSDMFLGAFSLFFLGLGMGTPLIILGASAGKLLPKAGNWMNHIKHGFGVILLMMAISLAERIAPPALTMTCWSALFVISSLFVLISNKSKKDNKSIFSMGIALLFFIYGILILIGVALGNTSPYLPLKTVQINTDILRKVQEEMLVVDTLKAASVVIKKAKLEHKKVLIDFYADWCASCHEMDEKVFNDPNVKSALKDTVFLKVNLTKRNSASDLLEKNFNVIAPPTLILLNNKGEESKRMVGETDNKTVIEALK